MSKEEEAKVEVTTKKPNLSNEQLQKNIDTLTEELNKADADKQTMFNIIMNVCDTVLMNTLKITESIAAMQKVSREAIEAMNPQMRQPQPGPPMTRVPANLPRSKQPPN